MLIANTMGGYSLNRPPVRPRASRQITGRQQKKDATLSAARQFAAIVGVSGD
jgi:hypothetical protein